MPTFLTRADVERPADRAIDGLDLMGERRRDVLFGECGPLHAAITPQRKYHFTADGGGELLFDRTRHPHEQRDLASDTTAASTLDEVRRQLGAALSRRNHPAVKDGIPTATGPAPTAEDVRRRVWPGFHHRSDQTCDLLH